MMRACKADKNVEVGTSAHRGPSRAVIGRCTQLSELQLPHWKTRNVGHHVVRLIKIMVPVTTHFEP